MTRRLVQFASDLHLEHRVKPSFPALLCPAAPTLFLAGDIGNPHKRTYRDFMAYCSASWERVFVVAGNHELYNHRDLTSPTSLQFATTAKDALTACTTICGEFPNVHFIHRRRMDWDGVAVFGTTLWTDLAGLTLAQTRLLNDYNYIATSVANRLTPEDTRLWHLTDRMWLKAEIDAAHATGTPVIVLTHHLPTPRLIHDKYAAHPLTAAYAANCDDLLTPAVRGWFAGHSHGANRIRIPGNGILALNPCGYPGERDTTGYDPACVAELFVGEDHRDPLLVAAATEDHRDPLLVAAANMEETEELTWH